MVYDNDWEIGDDMNSDIVFSILQGLYAQQLNANLGGIVGGESEKNKQKQTLKSINKQ